MRADYPHCWDFGWQQDAQAAYLSNVSDPGGLDGLAGPDNGNGLACEQLPVDPSRPGSTPVNAIKAAVTSAPSKAALLASTQTYFGASSDELPGDARSFDELDQDIGRAPGLLEFFDTWDHPYAQTRTKVVASWNRGAVPVLTWMPEPKGGKNKDLTQYTLDKINDGDWDVYLYQWAAQVVQTGLPMGMRFAHEMNGSWYPWSAGLPSITGKGADGKPVKVVLNNTPAKFVQAWRHVWDVFQQVGANTYVFWAWTPVSSLCTTHDPAAKSGRCGDSYTTYAEDYPGDEYTDWAGMSSYAYGSSSKYTFASTFKKSFTALAAVSGKPVYIAETGAAERQTGPGRQSRTFASFVTHSQDKARWTTQVLAGFLDQGSGSSNDYLNPGQRVAGFVLFDNYVPAVHSVGGVKTETDWRWNSSPVAAAAFRAGIADPRYRSGLMPSMKLASITDPDLVRWPVVVGTPPVAATAPAATSTTPTSPTPGAPAPDVTPSPPTPSASPSLTPSTSTPDGTLTPAATTPPPGSTADPSEPSDNEPAVP